MLHKKKSTLIVDETVHNLRRLFQAVNEQSKHAVHDSGLSGSQLWAINILFEKSGQRLTISHLAQQMCMNSSTVVRLTDGLELKGFVQRERCTTDRRVVYVRLTEQGNTLVRQAPDVAQHALVNGLKSLSENRLAAVASGIAKLVHIIEAQKYVA
ncbi:MAG: MarR family transcriptional regulator [Geobacter sp.]|jgi:DNA-binding MarR family transcriptional regulator|nr:MarR family transcriptional regulator [Geobacter sp.]